MQKIVLMPAYEPDKKMIQLVRELKDKHFNIVIVNDGSSHQYDNYFQACAPYALILKHRDNQGKGEALKSGLKWIHDYIRVPAVVVSADCDGQHCTEDIERITEEAVSMPGSLVLGMRNFRQKDVPVKSRIGNVSASLIFALESGHRIYDTQTGLRAFTSDLIPVFLQVSGSRYEYEMNVLFEAVKQGIPVHEKEIHTIYIEKNKSSHFHVFRDFFLISKEILKFSLSSFGSFLTDYMLFLLFSGYMSLIAANIGARIISASFNYTVNRNLVFHHHENIGKSLFQYALLAGIILCLNTGILLVFTNVLMIPAGISKIMAELIMFVFSYIIQHTFIFAMERKVL